MQIVIITLTLVGPNHNVRNPVSPDELRGHLEAVAKAYGYTRTEPSLTSVVPLVDAPSTPPPAPTRQTDAPPLAPETQTAGPPSTTPPVSFRSHPPAKKRKGIFG